MKAVLDASAVVSILRGEPGAVAASEAAVDGSVPAINLAEARDRLLRSMRDRPAVISAFELLLARGLRVLPCDRELAERAADLRAAHYDRRHTAVSIADCFAIAAAHRAEAALISCDEAQLRVAAATGVRVVPIAGADGRVAAI